MSAAWQFASREAYKAALDDSKDAVISHYAAEVAKAAEEARIQRQAAMWQRLAAMTLDEVRICAIRAPGMAAFLNTFES